MRRRTPLRFEVMEARWLLSALSYSLTTDKSVYQAGDTINFTFTETNTSTQPVTVTVLPADFTVTQGLTTIFASNPPSSSETGTRETLQPGQSVTQTGTWNGTQAFITSPIQPGLSATQAATSNTAVPVYSTQFNVWGSFAVSNANAPAVTAAFQITDPLVYSVSTNKTDYQVGQPVEFTSHATNTSSHPVTILNIRSLPESFDVSQDGKTIWSGGILGIVVDPLQPPAPFELETTTIQPGGAATYTTPWYGVLSPISSTESTATGLFEASLAGFPQVPSASFEIGSAITYTLSVEQGRFLDEPGNQAGQPVPMTFTETNTSHQPAAVVVKPPDFTVSSQYSQTVVWQSDPNDVGAPGITEILQPGQSITQKVTWDDIGSQGSLASASAFGLFSVTNQNEPVGLVAGFGTVDQVRTSLTTNQQSYRPGTPANITLTETNTSAYPVVLVPSGKFTVSNLITGKLDSSLTSVLSQPAMLDPGQSLSRTVTWIPSQTGTFIFAYQDAQVGYVGANQLDVTKTAPNQPGSPIALELTTNRGHYREGQVVVITLTVKNTSTSAISLTPTDGDAFSAISGSTLVWSSSLSGRRALARPPEPGKSITLRALWNGRPNQPGLQKLAPGVYTLEASLAGDSTTAEIRITA